jgi:predicted exporter
MNILLSAVLAAVVGFLLLVWAVHVVITVFGWILIGVAIVLAIKWLVAVLSTRSRV